MPPINEFLPQAAEPGANVVSQGTYAASGFQETGQQPGLGLSAFFNKVWRQGSMGMAVIGQFINNVLGSDVLDHGYSSAANEVTTLEGQFAAALSTFIGGLGSPKEVDVAFSATPVFDCSTANPVLAVFLMTLTGSVTSSTLVNLQKGQKVIFVLVQDSFGGHTFAFPANVNGQGDIDPGSAQTSRQEFIGCKPFGAVIAVSTSPMISS